jgi:hypothetical protein
MEASSLFWYVFWAGIGGLLVFIGIVAEEVADKHWYKNQESHKCWNRVRFAGIWFGVVLGVLIEVIVAAVTACNEWRNEPLNLPVSTVEVDAQIAVASPFWLQPRPISMEDTSLDLTGKDIHTNLAFFYLVPRYYPQEWGLNGFQNGKSNSIAVEINFEQIGASPIAMLDAFNGRPHPRNPTVKEVLSEIKAMLFYVDFIPTNCSIVGGQAILKVNGFTKEFKIPEQGAETNCGIVYMNPNWHPDPGLYFFATNAP